MKRPNVNVTMHMYNLKEYSDYYAKASGISWNYHRDVSNDTLNNSNSRQE